MRITRRPLRTRCAVTGAAASARCAPGLEIEASASNIYPASVREEGERAAATDAGRGLVDQREDPRDCQRLGPPARAWL